MVVCSPGGLFCLAFGLAIAGLLCAFQMPFREYAGQEYNDFPLPADYKDKTEFVFARLMYPQGTWGIFGWLYRFDWREGRSAWTNDYPRADRHFVLALRRLTRLEMRSVEQPVSPDDGDDIYNWPFLYCAGPDQWNMSDAELGQGPRVPGARRIPAGRRLLGRGRLVLFPAQHEQAAAGPAHRRN